MLLQPRARAKGIDLMIDFDMFLPTRFVGDPGRLRQVLTNLMGNAVKFTEKGHVLIRVVGLEAETGMHQLHVTVEDTGIGIPPEYLDHIFGEFNQVESDANRKFEGTGLGLAITQRLIERMEGAVWVDSEVGKGSCFGFRITLPVAEDAGSPQLPIDLKRVLVVDDQFINRTILERQLQPCGVGVHLCRNGAEALEVLARDADFDAVLTDHNMPEMDGLTLTLRIREMGLTLPIVLLTSDPACGARYRCLRRTGRHHPETDPAVGSLPPASGPDRRSGRDRTHRPGPAAGTAPDARPDRRGQPHQSAGVPEDGQGHRHRTGLCQQRPRGGGAVPELQARPDLHGHLDARDGWPRSCPRHPRLGGGPQPSAHRRPDRPCDGRRRRRHPGRRHRPLHDQAPAQGRHRRGSGRVLPARSPPAGGGGRAG